MQDMLILENETVRLSPLSALHWELLWPVAQQIDLYQFGSNDVSTVKMALLSPLSFLTNATKPLSAVPVLV